MNEKVVNYKINNAINKNTDSNTEAYLPSKNRPQGKSSNWNDSKKDKKVIIPFKKSVVIIMNMMVFMKVPESAMHDVFVHTPGHPFH